MSLPADLLSQAKHLAALDSGRPKQASLRRAVSAAYYALFHHVTDLAAWQTAGDRTALRRRIARSFAHGELKEVCQAIVTATKGQWRQPQQRIANLFSLPLEPDLFLTADAFIQLQEARHAADYDLSARLTRQDTQRSIQQAESALAALKRLQSTENLAAFLAALAFAKRWDR